MRIPSCTLLPAEGTLTINASSIGSLKCNVSIIRESTHVDVVFVQSHTSFKLFGQQITPDLTSILSQPPYVNDTTNNHEIYSLEINWTRDAHFREELKLVQCFASYFNGTERIGVCRSANVNIRFKDTGK